MYYILYTNRKTGRVLTTSQKPFDSLREARANCELVSARYKPQVVRVIPEAKKRK